MKFSVRNLLGPTRRLAGFDGGITPAPGKSRSLRSAIMRSPIPPFLYFPLKQPHCTTASPCVKPGDYVLKGQKIAEPGDATGLPVHASSSGTVIDIADHSYPDEFGSQSLTVCIETDGMDAWVARSPPESIASLTPETLLQKIRQAGIGGLGGAGFPTWRKLKTDSAIETLIINAAECEPYITADQALIREHALEVVAGIRIVQQACQAIRCLIAIEADKEDAIAALQVVLQSSDIELVAMPPKYPTGSEKQLIQLLTGKQVPAGKHPSDIGVLVVNAGTAHAIHHAVILDEPLLSRITTVCGDTLKTPKNFCTLIGTPVGFLLELCGVDYAELSRVVMGGPLMGITLGDLRVPVIKTSNCLIAASIKEFPPAAPEQACIRCGYCSSACPASLLPQQLYANIRAGKLDRAQQIGLADCIECGVCAYVCPSHIPLVQYYRGAKFELTEQLARQETGSKWQQRYLSRQQRLNENVKRKQGNRRRTVANVAIVDVTDSALQHFSRDTAKTEIANALARVKARKTSVTATNNSPGKQPGGEKD